MGIISTLSTGELNRIPNCYIRGQQNYIYMYNLPEISDKKGAEYHTENGMGRSMPYRSFNTGSARTISWKCTFISYDSESIVRNMRYLRLLESFVYPRRDPANIIPYIPPVILSIKCGSLLADESVELNAIMLSYGVTFLTDQVWNTDYGTGTYLPLKLEVGLELEIIYDTRYLPGAERIVELGA